MSFLGLFLSSVSHHLFCSAHGVPESYIKAGDPYKDHIEECAQLISKSLDNILNRDSRSTSVVLPGKLTHISRFHGFEGQSHETTPDLPTVNCELSFQSRVGPVQWLRPYTDQKIPEMASQGVKNLIVVPISFVSEHIETLEEIDIEYQSVGLKTFSFFIVNLL